MAKYKPWLLIGTVLTGVGLLFATQSQEQEQPSPPSPRPNPLPSPWKASGGVSRRKVGPGSMALAVFGGWTVTDKGAQRWADALLPHFPGVGVLYAVSDAAVKLSSLKDAVEADAIKALYGVAHSNGSKAAKVFMRTPPAGVTVRGYNLDGYAVPGWKRVRSRNVWPGEYKDTHMKLIDPRATHADFKRGRIDAVYRGVTPETVYTGFLH